jgi:16S rRNA C1402 N4-methylase RsmH
MEAMREKWTDERLDDLNHRVDEGFKEAHREFQALRLEIRTEFRGLRSEMATLNRTMLQIEAGAIATFAIGLLGLAAAQF